MASEIIPDLPDDVGDALYEYRQAIRNVLLDGGKNAVAAETETYAAFVAAFYAALAAERARVVGIINERIGRTDAPDAWLVLVALRDELTDPAAPRDTTREGA